ncbi:putative MFS transporter [Polychaeton citri CBS 116435]|uniref:MFS transporter n=1 Tax=Polychaeton citri CBS 116435 TaxID=1314669 RepID=A0A9P4Q4E8_9PEZI|nr:putative MFS transporter [Polychaeton citri CBS 116435]
MGTNSNHGLDEASTRKARISTVVAGTCIALACGTNYAYGAWAPDFAERLDLTATQEEMIGNFGNIGMYAVGIPFGYLIDNKGPKWGVVLGLILLASGYFPLHSAYDKGTTHGGTSIGWLCFFAFLIGVGSCSSFAASIKVCASNWPDNRGTATAFPLSGFGLSALLFMTLGGLIFKDTGGLLLFLSIGTFSMIFVGMFFLRIIPLNGPYEAISTRDEDDNHPRARRDSNKPHRPHSRQSSKSSARSSISGIGNADETSSLVSSATSSAPEDIWETQDDVPVKPESVHSDEKSTDVTGLALLKSPKFYQLFIMLGLLCGVGLMTINNIGNNARALWHHYDPSKPASFIQNRQLMHVSNLSFFSFVGRLSSGIGSDWLVHRGHSRFWTLVASACVFTIAQICGLQIQNPNWLFLLSGLSGLGYGALFGVYPSLVADAFGPSGLGVNWGAMTLAPVVSGNFFNLAYGAILDAHSVVRPKPGGQGEERVCEDGRECYASAYWVTLLSSIVGVGWSLWLIRHEHVQHQNSKREGSREHEG